MLKSYLFNVLLLLMPVTIVAQDFPDVAVPDLPKNNEDQLDRQLQYNYVQLYQIEEFPFKKIYKTNKDIEKLVISISYNLNSLPKSIKKLKALKEVSISGVAIEKFPEGLCTISGLEKLTYRNSHTTNIPKDIGNLDNLKQLELSILPITEIPKEIGDLKAVVKLDISNTKGNKKIANKVFKLTGIKTLPKEIGKLTTLEELLLYSNSFTELPTEIGNLSKLKRLVLYKNDLTSLPDEICKLKNLEILELADNNLTSLPEDIGDLTNLTVIRINNNNIKTLPDSIKNLKKLVGLFCTGTEIPEEELRALKQHLPNTRIFKGKDIK